MLSGRVGRHIGKRRPQVRFHPPLKDPKEGFATVTQNHEWFVGPVCGYQRGLCDLRDAELETRYLRLDPIEERQGVQRRLLVCLGEHPERSQ